MDETAFISTDEMLKHWQGHRALTRRVIEAFPEEALFTYSIGGMRPFGKLADEMLRMGVPSVEGAATRVWPTDVPGAPTTKAELLARWDADTARLNELWPTIPPERFAEDDLAFGAFPGTISWLLHYVIDNEIHHRGQGYVYLRALGIEPPPFYER